MPKIDSKKYLQVEAAFVPPVRSIADVLCAKKKATKGPYSRQALEKSDLNFGVILANKKTKEAGIKVVVDDEKLEKFLSKKKGRKGS